MTYRIQLDTKSQMFIVIGAQDQQRQAAGRTIEQAIAKLKTA